MQAQNSLRNERSLCKALGYFEAYGVAFVVERVLE